MSGGDVPRVVVTAAVVERGGEFLVSRRLRGAHLEGLWEFPGGKCEAGESLQDCLKREIREELDCDVEVGAEMLATSHAYDERVVEIHFFACVLIGSPRPVLGQELRWIPRRELRALAFPPADGVLINRLVG